MNETAQSLRLRLRSIQYLTGDTNLFELVSADGTELPQATAGSHVTLRLPELGERAYSLILDAHHPRSYLIAVRRIDSGRGGSHAVHAFRVGEIIEASGPRNHFPLVEDAEATLLFAGGIGVTPILSMARRLRDLGRPYRLHYASRSRAAAALLDDVEALGGVSMHFDDEAAALFSFSQAIAGVAETTHLYCCGPAPMMALFEETALAAGFPPEQIHTEYFAAKNEPALDHGFSVELVRSGRAVQVEPGQSILSALRKIGVAVITSCEEGICGACETRVIAGEIDHRDAVLTAADRAAGDTMMICCSGAKSPRLVLDL